MLEFLDIFKKLDFLSESVRLQYTNFIITYQDQIPKTLTIDQIIKRIRNHEPIEYIFNLAEFYGYTFFVDQRSLIPRPETEVLVNKTVDFIQTTTKPKLTIIDIGTGSGCIIISLALTLKKRNPTKEIEYIAIDTSKDALEVASINAKKHSCDGMITFINTSFQDIDLSTYNNLIVCSNLPYIPDNEVLQPSVYNFEPHTALFGGTNGDELNQALIAQVKNSPNVLALFMEGYNGDIVSFS